MTAQGTAIPNKSYWDYFKWVPVINPAVEEYSYTVDSALLASRVSAIAKIAFTLLVASIPMYLISAFGSVVLISMAAVTLSLPYIDSWAAERAADVKAVNEYLQKKDPSINAAKRIKENLSAAQMFVRKKGDPNKPDRLGNTFSRHIKELDFDVFKCLVDGGMKLNAARMGEIVQFSNPRFLEYLLAKKNVTAADFTPDEQVYLWRKLGNQSAAAILALYGFDVNIRDSEGFTPLLAVLECEKLNSLDSVVHVKALLQCGANKSLAVTIKGQSKTALELTDDPKIREAINNTVAETPTAKPSCWEAFRKIPVIYPALEQNSCVIDKSLLAYRVAAVAKIAFAMLVLAIPLAAISPLSSMALVVLSALSHALPRLDSWRAESAADAKAVNEYLQMQHPTVAARWRVVANPKLISLLVKKKGDVNKTDECGFPIANSIRDFDFDTFKCLVDGGMDMRSSLYDLVGKKDPAFLEYVLTQNKVKASDFTESEQNALWLQLRNQESGILLLRSGFNINSRSSQDYIQGYTPLMIAASSSHWHCESRERVKILLACGADKSLTVSATDPRNPKKKILKTARDCASHADVKKLFA